MIRRTALGVAGATLLLTIGCSKTEEAPTTEAAPAEVEATAAADPAAAAPAEAPAPAPAPQGAEKLPGENTVREAMAKKDYETAVGGLLALRGAATGDRHEAYLSLYGEVIDTLRVEASQDRKAATALAQLQMATRGR